jgi:carbon monoxide dehydrogenase subunit G
MAVKVGPVSTSYKGKIVFERLDPDAHTAEIVASGQDVRGRGGADLRLTSSIKEVAPGETEVTAASKVNITGILAQMGRGMVQDVSDQLFQTFSQRMRAELEPTASPASTTITPAAAPSPAAAPVAAAASAPGEALDLASLGAKAAGRAASRAARRPAVWVAIAIAATLLYLLFR